VTIFSQDNLDWKDAAKAAFASASIPTIFPPFIWDDGRIFMDGGTIRNVNTLSAIEQCKQLVDDESKITVDVMVCTGPDVAEPMTEDASNTMEWWWRSRGLSDGYLGSNIYKQDMIAHPDVNWRYMAW